MKEITYISLFSGIGGFELGLENSKHNFKCLGYSEIDKYAKSIYQKHYPDHLDLGDATKIRTEDLPEFDLLVGGFPCQAFSIAGERRGFDDTRGTLFFEIARILKDKRPRYFLLENVRGLLSHDKGKTFKTILEILTDIGYYVKWEVFNSKDYNVPQNRERVFIKGYSRTECGGEVLSFRTNDEKYSERITSNKLIVENLPQKVYKRKYPIDIQQLQKLLKSHKTQQGLTNQEIADILNLPLTNVAHWFRTDKYFSIPSKDIWFDLKEVLNITDDSFDKPITEFEELDSKYDMTNCCYNDKGIAPTLKADSKGELIKEHRDTLQLNTKHKTYQDGRIYSHNGLSIALNARGNNGWYTTNNEEEQEIKEKYSRKKETDVIKKNFSKVDENRKIATTKDGNCFAVNTRPRFRPLSKKLDSYVLEGKEVNQKYRIRRLTPVECERLQAFPDNWTALGKDNEEISNTQRYKCIGNAVTTTVITFIANEMFDHERS